MNRKYVAGVAIFGLSLLVTFVTSLARPVHAETSALRRQATPQPTSAITPSPTPTPGSSTTITENIFHIIAFPFEAMTDAVVNMSNKIVGQAYEQAEGIYGEALGQIIFGDYGLAPTALDDDGLSTPLFTNIIQPHWGVVFGLALLLLPATLALTTVSAMRSGVTSAFGYVELREALLGWVIAAGAAAASYYLLGLVHRLSLSVTQSLLLADFGERVSGLSLASAFFNISAATALAGMAAFAPIAGLYVGFFVLFLASSVVLGLVLALAAYTALVYMLSAIAPLVIILGVLPPLRWLHALWLKAVTLVFLLPVADALLLKAAVSLTRSFYDPQGAGASLGSVLSGLFVTGGVVSVLIAINFKVGESMFGALGEIHRQAWSSAIGLAQLAVTALGFATGSVGMAVSGSALAGANVGPSGGGGVSGPLAMPTETGTTEAPISSSTVGQGASGLKSNPIGLAQRMQDLLASKFARPDTHQSADNTAPATDSESQAAPEADASTPGIDSDELMRRARLTASLGHALRGMPGPLAQSIGAGLQMSGALGQYAADHHRPGESAHVATGQPHEQSTLNTAMHWSGRDLSHAPNELFDVGRDNTALMAGALHQSFLNDPNDGRATDMRAVLPVIQQSYGQWLTQSRPGGVQAQRAYFEMMADSGNAQSAGRLTGALNQWASDHAVQLPASLPQSVQAVFDTSQRA